MLSIGNKIVLDIALGVVFWNVADKEPEGQVQISFQFCVMLVTCLASVAPLPKLINGRMIMKIETSGKQYHEASYLIAVFVVDTIVGLIGIVCFITDIYAFSGLPWEYFGSTLYLHILHG